jgi:hypothetical protein
VIEDVSTDGANTYMIANPGEWSQDEETALEAQRDAAAAPIRRRSTAAHQPADLSTRGIRMFDKPSRKYDALQFTRVPPLLEGAVHAGQLHVLPHQG